MTAHILQPEARAFAEATSQPPYLADLGVEGARRLLDDVQSALIDLPDIDGEWISIPTPAGQVRVRIVKPPFASEALPVVLYMHGGGWVLGNAGRTQRTSRRLHHRRRERRPPGRRRRLRSASHRRGRPHHARTVRRHHPRLHDAQPPPLIRRHNGRRRTSNPHTPQSLHTSGHRDPWSIRGGVTR